MLAVWCFATQVLLLLLLLPIPAPVPTLAPIIVVVVVVAGVPPLAFRMQVYATVAGSTSFHTSLGGVGLPERTRAGNVEQPRIDAVGMEVVQAGSTH